MCFLAHPQREMCVSSRKGMGRVFERLVVAPTVKQLVCDAWGLRASKADGGQAASLALGLLRPFRLLSCQASVSTACRRPARVHLGVQLWGTCVDGLNSESASSDHSNLDIGAAQPGGGFFSTRVAHTWRRPYF